MATGEAIPLRGLEGVPGLPGAPQDEAGLMRKLVKSRISQIFNKGKLRQKLNMVLKKTIK